VTEPALAPIPITVNGEPHRVPAGSTVRSLLERLAIASRVAVAIDRDVVPRAQHPHRPLRPGDRIEILEAVGGG
jgi:sulfur carrier protein